MATLRNMCVIKTGIIVKLSRMSVSHRFANPHLSSACLQRLFHTSCARSACDIWRQGPKQSPRSCNVKRTFITPLIVSGNLAGQKLYYSTEKPGITEEILKANNPQATPEEDINKDNEPQPKEESKKKDKWYSGKNAWKIGLLSLGGMGILMGVNILIMWGAPIQDKDGNEIIDEFTIMPAWKGYPRRAWKEIHFFKTMIQEPSQKKLLPDPMKYPYHQPKYTLVLELTGVLVHPDWTLNSGWRFKKRPAVEQFLQQLVLGSGGPPDYEIVVYTRESGFTAAAIADGLDPNGFIMYKLFRDATRYMNGSHVKDLDCLNRDTSKVIIVDCDPSAIQLHPRNAVLLKKWTGNDEDRTLIDLASFLRTIAMSDVEDVRTVLDHYNSYDDPIEAFKENQRRLQEQQTLQAKSVTDQPKSLVSGWASSLTGRRK